MRHAWTFGIALLACQPTGTGADRAAPAATDEPAARPVDTRDQYALLADIEATLGDALTRDGGAMAAARHRWQGHRFRWELAHVPVLCRSATACHLAPFDHARFGERRIQQGWMPKLELDEAGFAALGRLCAERRPCVVQIEATLREFVFDPELPTSVTFSDVELVGARDATPGESWIASGGPRRRA